MPGGGGSTPTSTAQHDPHVALTILTTRLWGGGECFGGQNVFGPTFVFRRQHPVLHKTKGPARKPISLPSPPPPSAGVRAPPPPPPAPRVTFRRVAVSLRGPGQSPLLPFACCVSALRSVGRCSRCSCWCRFRVRGAQWSVCWGCADPQRNPPVGLEPLPHHRALPQPPPRVRGRVLRRHVLPHERHVRQLEVELDVERVDQAVHPPLDHGRQEGVLEPLGHGRRAADGGVGRTRGGAGAGPCGRGRGGVEAKVPQQPAVWCPRHVLCSGAGNCLKTPPGGGGARSVPWPAPADPLCDIPSGCCFFTGPWTVTRSSLRMLRRVATFCRPLRPVLLLVSFPRSRSPVVGVLGLCWMWHGVPFACQRRPVIGILRMCWLLPGSFDCFCCPHTSVHRPSIACLAVFLCGPGAPTPPHGGPPNAPAMGNGCVSTTLHQ